MGDMSRGQWIVAAILALVVILFSGALIATIGLGVFRSDLPVHRMPEYFWFYRHNEHVMRWLALGLGASTIVVLLGGGFLLLRRSQSLHGDARWARAGEARKAGLMDQNGLLLGKMGSDFIQLGGTEHVLLEAPTRAGKGVGVVIPNLLTWADSVVVLDVKQENWEKSAGWRKQLGHQVFLFDPLDRHGRTARYNPLGHINRNDPIEVIDELQKIAAMLWPPPANGDSFWSDSARTAFIGVAAYVAATPELPFTIGEIYRNFSAGDAKSRFPKIIKEREEAGNPLSGPCVSALTDWYSSSANTFTSIRQSVSAKINLWLNPYVDAATSESDFDLREFRDKPISLYLGVSPDNMERMADVYNLLFQQLIDLNVRELPGEGKHPLKLLLLLDEFARLGRASVIASGFSYVAGYGIRLLPVIQARGQLRDVYGADVTNEIVQNCGVELVFTPKDNAVAKEISERLGNYTYSAKSKSKKVWDAWEGSVSTSEQRRPLMLPQELLLMSQDDVVVLRAGIRPLKGRKIRYYKDRWMVDASSVQPPSVAERPLDPDVARRSLAIIESYEQPEEGVGGESRASQRAVPMSDSQALNGIELESLAGFPTEGLPDDGDPAKAVEYFKVAGLTFDPTWLDRNREKFGSAADEAGSNADQPPESDAFENISEKRKQA